MKQKGLATPREDCERPRPGIKRAGARFEGGMKTRWARIPPADGLDRMPAARRVHRSKRLPVTDDCLTPASEGVRLWPGPQAPLGGAGCRNSAQPWASRRAKAQSTRPSDALSGPQSRRKPQGRRHPQPVPRPAREPPVLRPTAFRGNPKPRG